MRKVKDAVDLTTNEKIYFKGHAKATYLSDGRNVEDALAEIPSGESSVFEAIYGKTTFAEIVEAYNAGKSVTCRYGQTIAQLISITDSVIYFTSIDIKRETRFICYSSNNWSYSTHDTGHELKTLDKGNVQVTIAGNTAEVATPQYVANLLGTIINGDY